MEAGEAVADAGTNMEGGSVGITSASVVTFPRKAEKKRSFNPRDDR